MIQAPRSFQQKLILKIVDPEQAQENIAYARALNSEVGVQVADGP
jgi:hypothetical protein